ncbi:MAG: elongation factor G [Planctomycetaceae bacterium]|nr:elongation factor G [Planctomycetaceae bacterium]MCP4461608.1 elongation factor G [Planctomycetaceae bacterium]MDG1808576.1 elongation factor G [Pirellulaceae bacterium]MDG2105960.1 elongation factor G [Pirellulaceae bacterium]
MARKLENIRNIGIIAHIDAGKTTVTERMLFVSGNKHRVGMVDKGTTETDTDEEEQNRGITIYSACVTFKWKDVDLNLIDTPGHVDFTAEVERSLRVLDGAVTVFSAREGVEAQSETVWRQADRYQVPRIAFINKLDREGAGFERVVEEVRQRLGGNPLPIQMPIGLGPKHVDDPFRGLIDLIKMKVQTFDSDGKALKETPIPEELRDEADFARQAMLEELYNYSDEMTELALSEEAIPNELIRKVIRKATLAQMIQPVVCGSALHGIGVQGVLDSVKYYLPSPLDRPPVEGTNPRKEGLTEVRKPDPKEPFCGLVFKIQPERTGDFYWIRVYSGELTENTRVLCPGKDKKENVAQLWQIHAQKKERDGKVPSVSSGDIVGVIGPRFAVTGDTLCDSKAPILLEEIEFPETVIEMAIEPESTAERKKLGDTLEMLKRQDPTFQAVENEDTGQTLISGMGELHLEVIKNRLLRDFNLNVKVHKPRVSYRETVAQKVEVTGECHRLVAGQQLFAKLTLILEPDEQIEGVRILRGGIAAELPADMMEAVMEELQSRGQGGGVIGSFPLTGLKITLSGCEVNPEQSNAMAFSIAAGEAFEEALKKAIPVLLEPVMKLNITTPDDYYGDFVSDLAQRRARVVNTDSHAGMTFIEANAPLAELFGYAGAMRSLSQGRAGSSMEPLQYEPAPDSVKDSFAF